jgi:hypothetical protein
LGATGTGVFMQFAGDGASVEYLKARQSHAKTLIFPGRPISALDATIALLQL